MNVKPKTNIEDLFQNARNNQSYLKVCAPMVRYSKLEFRRLVRKYNVDLCFTPMIMTDSFCQSEKARLSEFSTSTDDTPVIAQLAANTVHEYLSATEMVYPYVDGIDLNCGCPQRWAMQSGFGCALLNDPELMKDLTSTIRRNFPNSFSVSVKIRVQKPLTKTIDLCRQLEKCGVTFLTVHGRTPSQKIKEPSNAEFLREIKQSISVPLIANGDCKSLQDANEMHDKIKCDGVMAARAILANPTLFSGEFESTPLECVQEWINLGAAAGDRIVFQNFHHHLTFMMEKLIQRKQRVVFNSFTRKQQVFDYLDDEFDIRPQSIIVPKNIECIYDESSYRQRLYDLHIQQKRSNQYDSEKSLGKFFMEKISKDSDQDVICDGDGIFTDTNIFDIV